MRRPEWSKPSSWGTLGTSTSLVITIVLLGLLASLSPATIVVFILLLATTRAKVNAAAFLIGWSVSLVVVFSVSYVVGGTHGAQHGGGRIVIEIIEILLGVDSFSLRSDSGRPETSRRPPLASPAVSPHACKGSIRGRPQSWVSSSNRGRSPQRPPSS